MYWGNAVYLTHCDPTNLEWEKLRDNGSNVHMVSMCCRSMMLVQHPSFGGSVVAVNRANIVGEQKYATSSLRLSEESLPSSCRRTLPPPPPGDPDTEYARFSRAISKPPDVRSLAFVAPVSAVDSSADVSASSSMQDVVPSPVLPLLTFDQIRKLSGKAVLSLKLKKGVAP